MDKLLGIAPELRRMVEGFFGLQSKAAIGDMVLVCTPAVLGSSAAAVNAAIASPVGYFERSVEVRLETAAGSIHEWFDGSFTIAGSKASVGGTATSVGGTVVLKKGRGTAKIRYTGAWLAAETATLTVTGDTLYGAVVGNKTSVDTLVA